MAKGRPILGAISGLFLGIFLGLDLLIFKVAPLGTLQVIVLPAAGLILGLALGFWGPLGRRARA